jgi:hypothetical protein
MRLLGDWNWWPGGRKKSVFRANGEREIGSEKLLAGTVLLYLARRAESANGESPHLLRALSDLVEPDGKDPASERALALRATEEMLKPLASALLLDYLAKEKQANHQEKDNPTTRAKHPETNSSAVANVGSITVVVSIVLGVLVSTGIIAIELIGLKLGVVVLAGAGVICALLLPSIMRALSDPQRRPGGVESVSEARGMDGPPRGDRRSLGDGVSHTGEQGGKDAQDAVGRGERQDDPEHGYSRGDYDDQRKVRRVADPEHQKRRPRPGKAHLDSLHRLGRELHHAAGYSDGEQAGPGTEDGTLHPRERSPREER